MVKTKRKGREFRKWREKEVNKQKKSKDEKWVE